MGLVLILLCVLVWLGGGLVVLGLCWASSRGDAALADGHAPADDGARRRVPHATAA